MTVIRDDMVRLSSEWVWRQRCEPDDDDDDSRVTEYDGAKKDGNDSELIMRIFSWWCSAGGDDSG